MSQYADYAGRICFFERAKTQNMAGLGLQPALLLHQKYHELINKQLFINFLKFKL